VFIIEYLLKLENMTSFTDSMLHSILSDPIFTQLDKEWLIKFNDEVHHRIHTSGVNFGITMFSLADGIGMDLTTIHKEGPFMFALWVILLAHFKEFIKMEDMKYPTIESFQQAYSGWFVDEGEIELIKLWNVANWMNILFKMITARKNKGLAMQVVPKLIEGWEVKYVTGSGQTRFTANRVHIFETEGNVKANHRSKFKSSTKKYRSGTGENRRMAQPTKKELAGSSRRRRRYHRKKVGGHPEDDSLSAEDEVYYVYAHGGHRLATDSSDMDGDEGSDGSMDSDGEEGEYEGDDGTLNEDIKKVFEAFSHPFTRDETDSMDLIRDVSNLRFDNNGNPIPISTPNHDLSPDIPMKRELSWNEIPLSGEDGLQPIMMSPSPYPFANGNGGIQMYYPYGVPMAAGNMSDASTLMYGYAVPPCPPSYNPNGAGYILQGSTINDLFNGYNNGNANGGANYYPNNIDGVN
jgi:hypothetical protein